MTEVAALLAAFLEATGRDAAVWERREGAVTPTLLGASSEPFAERTLAGASAWDVATWARLQSLHAQLVTTGDSVGWLFVEPGHAADADRLLGRLVPVVRRLTRERDAATRELAERYEEINLLYAIGELLGGSTSVEEVADTLLGELAATVGAQRAVFLQAQRAQGKLVPLATLGLNDGEYDAVALERHEHIAVRALRANGACTQEGTTAGVGDPVLAAHGAPLLAAPITRPSGSIGITGTFAIPSRRGAEAVATPLGVLVLAGRDQGPPFTEGDRKLAAAVGTQIGIAMHNVSLVRAAVERQQMVREMQLANELQLTLLPKPSVVLPEARAAARVIPAESVGGDFFLLARLDRDRTGVLIGDVSGHGYRAALIMALALSAAGIHVQAAFDPAVALESVRRSLRDELEQTEMSISLCYAVIDARARELRFANAGHPHAFVLAADGHLTRLGAVVPPLGWGENAIEECVMTWKPGHRLVFFTDGVVDARNAQGRPLSESAILQTLSTMTRSEPPEQILEALIAQLEAHVGKTALRDDCAVLVVDRP